MALFNRTADMRPSEFTCVYCGSPATRFMRLPRDRRNQVSPVCGSHGQQSNSQSCATSNGRR